MWPGTQKKDILRVPSGEDRTSCVQWVVALETHLGKAFQRQALARLTH